MKPPPEDTTLELLLAEEHSGPPHHQDQSGVMHIDHPTMRQVALAASQPFPLVIEPINVHRVV